MKYPILILLILTSQFSFSQNKTYQIKDKTTNELISLVAIVTQKGTGTYSDESGKFSLSIASNDTLFVSHLSYQKVNLTKNDIDKLENLTIFLIPKVTELNETVIKPTQPTKMILGYYKEKTFFKGVGPGGKTDFSVFVNHIKNPTEVTGFLDKLYFDLRVELFEQSNSKARIRVFSVGSDGLPKDDVLTKEILKNIDRVSPNLKIDVSYLNIVFPPEGLFIGLEFFCNRELIPLKKQGHLKIKTDCPHIPTAKVSNYEMIGNSYYWSEFRNKMQWICYSNGKFYPGTVGHVYKFGAEISQ